MKLSFVLLALGIGAQDVATEAPAVADEVVLDEGAGLGRADFGDRGKKKKPVKESDKDEDDDDRAVYGGYQNPPYGGGSNPPYGGGSNPPYGGGNKPYGGGSNGGYQPPKPSYGGGGYQKPSYGGGGYQKPSYGGGSNYGSNGYGGGYEPTTEYYPQPTILPPNNTVTCFHCDAPTFEECYRIGKSMECMVNEGRPPVCMIELRKRDGNIFGVCMGCKAHDACLEAKKNNFNRKPYQCKPRARYGPSVCRQCCNSDHCTNNFNPYDRRGWEEDLINPYSDGGYDNGYNGGY